MAFEGLNLTKLNHLQVETGFTDAELRAIYGKLDKNRNGAGEGRIGCGVRRCNCSIWNFPQKYHDPGMNGLFAKCDGYCPLKFTKMCRWFRSIKTTNVAWLYYDCTRWCMIIVKARWREVSLFNHTLNCTLSTTGGSCSNVHVHADNTRKIPIPSCLLGVNGSSPWIWHMTIVNLQRSVKAKDSYHKLRWFVILRFS